MSEAENVVSTAMPADASDEEDAKYGFTRAEMNQLSLSGSVDPYDSHVILLLQGAKLMATSRRGRSSPPQTPRVLHQVQQKRHHNQGMSAYLTTTLDVVKTKMKVQGTAIRYKGWLDAIHGIWRIEGAKGFFKGSIPRVTWYIPASALTFMAVEFLREEFNEKPDHNSRCEVASLSIDKKGSSLQEVA